MEGPRAVKPTEVESLRALTGQVFRPSLMRDYPQLFHEGNWENLRVCVDDGRVVSHVGMTEQGAVLDNCRIQVACIGAVSTHPNYRQQGLASACFDDAVAKAYRDGIDLMIVSGDRNLYRMRGCMRVGRGLSFTVTPDNLPTVFGERITVEIMREGELPQVMACYRREPARFARPPEAYRFPLERGIVMDRPSDFLVIRAGGDFRAYAIVRRPREDQQIGLSEFAGDRHALLAALPPILARYEAVSLDFFVPGHDDLFRSLCEQSGLQGEPRATSGTYKLINFPQLMARMRPRFEERLGVRASAQLGFWQVETEYGFSFGEETFRADRQTATQMLFGAPDGSAAALAELDGALGEALRAVLPLPTLWYGINHV
jgi:predicted N-acetyltransferase YhbS